MKNGKFYFFWKHRFGQWTMRDMIIDGITYCCCEQYMMAEKARLFKDEETLNKIMASKNAKRIKDLGREVKNFDKEKWNEIVKEVVIKGNLAKFSQHDDFKELLLGTEDLILVESSPFDMIWGVGLAENDPKIMDQTQWRGTNWLGECLMEVRDRILINSCGDYGIYVRKQ